MMCVEDMLLKYPTISKDILKLNEDLRTAIEAKTNNDGCIKASIIRDTPHGTDTGDPTYEHTADLIEKLEEISIELTKLADITKQEIQDLIDIKKQIDYAYMYLTYPEQKIIQLRYFDFPSPKFNWRKVINESHYCDSQAYEIHSQALKKIKKLVNIGVNRSLNVG